jgi:hypothetical protein
MTTLRRAASILGVAALTGGCTIAQPEPPPNQVQGGNTVVQQGQVALAKPAETAFCVSQALPGSVVEPLLYGAVVRPAGVAGASPDYALTLWQAEEGVTWRLQAGGADPATTAERLDRALGTCVGELGRTA